MRCQRFLVLLVLCLPLVSCGGTDIPPPGASITLEPGGERQWRLIVTDRHGIPMRIRINWSDFDNVYRTHGYDGLLSGPLLGKPAPTFASVDDMSGIGRFPAESVKTFDPEVPLDPHWNNFDEVSVIHVFGGDFMIGRWEGEHITDILYVGPFVELLRERLIEHGEAPCDALIELCCREGEVRLAEDADPQSMPRPVVGACFGASFLCEDQSSRDAICPCMMRACMEIDMNLPWQLSTPAAGCCVQHFHACDGDNRARPIEESIDRFAGTMRSYSSLTDVMTALVDRLADDSTR